MADLFTPYDIGNLAVPNRFVRSATWEGMAEENGASTEQLEEFLCELARGGVGLVIPGHAYVSPEGQASPWQLGVHDDALLPGLKNLAVALHELGTPLVLQIAHSGAHALTKVTNLEAVGPSVVTDDKGRAVCREATPDDLERIKESFAAAAVRARKAGFDGVQLHGAHGYLLSEFLSPFFNHREDEYGGNQRNRARYVEEVVSSVRDAVGAEYPVMIKLNAADFLDRGMDVDQMLRSARRLVDAGIDCIELSGGTPRSGKLSPVRPGELETPDEEAYYSEPCERLKQMVDVPLILVGGIRSLETAQAVVDSGTADCIALSRPLIREPHLVDRWKSGDARRARCISDNGCFRPGIKGEGIHCTVEMKETGRKFIP